MVPDHQKSKSCIYLIYSKRCNKIYIGQTKDICNRIKNHMYDIKKIVPLLSDKNVYLFIFHFKGMSFHRILFFTL